MYVLEERKELVKRNGIFRTETIKHTIPIDGCCQIYGLPTNKYDGGLGCEKYQNARGGILLGECRCCKHFQSITEEED